MRYNQIQAMRWRRLAGIDERSMSMKPKPQRWWAAWRPLEQKYFTDEDGILETWTKPKSCKLFCRHHAYVPVLVELKEVKE